MRGLKRACLGTRTGWGRAGGGGGGGAPTTPRPQPATLFLIVWQLNLGMLPAARVVTPQTYEKQAYGSQSKRSLGQQFITYVT